MRRSHLLPAGPSGGRGPRLRPGGVLVRVVERGGDLQQSRPNRCTDKIDMHVSQPIMIRFICLIVH